MDAARRPSRAHGDKPTNTENGPRLQRSWLPQNPPTSMSCAVNGGGFIAVSRQGSAATC